MEFQFNLSEEPLFKGQKVFRYGLALSLEQSRSNTNPLWTHKERIQRINKFIRINKNYFEGFQLWIWDYKRGQAEKVRELVTDDIELNNFIFIGKFLEKTSEEITSIDLNRIILELEYLLPFYEYVELKRNRVPQKRLTRLTWNDYGWHFPNPHKWSKENRENSNKRFDEKYGFTYEEWLFNPRYRKDNFQYGFIQGVSRLRKELTKLSELFLFSIHPVSKQRQLIAILKDCEVISHNKKELDSIESLFQKHQSTAIEEIKSINGDSTFFSKYPLRPNVRFKYENAVVFDSFIDITKIIRNSKNRFQPFEVSKELSGFIHAIESNSDPELLFKSGKSTIVDEYGKNNKEGKSKVKRNHSIITDDLFEYLIKVMGYNKKQISIELSKVNNKLIDGLIKDDDEYIFFEAKTSSNSIMNIRQSIGQLLEYSLLDKKLVVSKLVIVGPASLNGMSFDYFNRLKETISLPIEYWEYKMEDIEIKSKFIITS